MIVRILGEGQFDVPEESLERLNALDSALEAAIEAYDQVAFEHALTGLLEAVRSVGTPHEAESLDQSDLILPYADASLDQVKGMLNDDGLIPG